MYKRLTINLASHRRGCWTVWADEGGVDFNISVKSFTEAKKMASRAAAMYPEFRVRFQVIKEIEL